MKLISCILLGCLIALSCSKDSAAPSLPTSQEITFDFKILALGDSYTKGQGVCSSCNFPQQLLDSLTSTGSDRGILTTVAQTGWTTRDLIDEVIRVEPTTDFDLVTLLIGVNNQYLELPIEQFETEFDLLLNDAIRFAGGDSSRVIVLSIPDYVFTPFGQTIEHPELVSETIDAYNQIARNATNMSSAFFIDITQMSRLGLEQPELVSADGLHLSAVGHKRIVELLFNRARQVIRD